jgi:hypothetical protein
MRRMSRILLLVSFAAVMPVLAGCSNFDPDSLDVFGLNEKKKLPGDRKAVFPEGVPGVSQGIPPQYMAGANQPPPADAAPVAPVEAAPAAAPRAKKTASFTQDAKPKVKRAPKPRPATAQQQQAPAGEQPAPWPDQPAPQQSGGGSPWPAPPPSGTFSR